MSGTIFLALAPLALGTVLYVAQAVGYATVLERPWLALTFIGYTLGNIGFLGDALTSR